MALAAEEQRPEGREREGERVQPSVRAHRRRLLPAQVAEAGAAVAGRVAVPRALRFPPRPTVTLLKSFLIPDTERIGFHMPPKRNM